MRFLTLVAALTILGVSGCRPAGTTGGNVSSSSKKPTREEFRKLVMGKTKDEVLATVGKPEFTGSHNSNREFWHYSDLVVDPVNGKRDWRTTVNFEGGIVVSTDP
jgi:outer membrane protein assembly factor BamE (lipoprotein component of BamABCDE complex)